MEIGDVMHAYSCDAAQDMFLVVPASPPPRSILANAAEDVDLSCERGLKMESFLRYKSPCVARTVGTTKSQLLSNYEDDFTSGEKHTLLFSFLLPRITKVAERELSSYMPNAPCTYLTSVVVLFSGVFPTTAFLKDSGIEMDQRGFVSVDKVSIAEASPAIVEDTKNVNVKGFK